MALSGTFTPRLGLDLQGGTSVILTPKSTQAGQKVNSGAVDKAVDIIRQRVDGLGVAESEVKRSGNQIEISVPGRGRADVVDLVGQTAELRYREVYDSGVPLPATEPTPTPGATAAPSASPTPGATLAPSATPSAAGSPAAGATPTPGATPAAATASPTSTPTPTPSASPSAGSATTPPDTVVKQYEALTCAPQDIRGSGGGSDNPSDWAAACDKDGTTKYLLKPAAVVGTDIKTASAGLLQTSAGGANINTGQWVVNVDFTGSGQGKFTKLTEETQGKQVAIVLDGVVQSAPVTNERIPGSAQISGSFTQESAEDLANVLKYGALPLAFEKSQAESISPTLGRQELRGGLLAMGIGLALVILYSLVYYRLLGFVVIASLAISGVLVYAAVTLLGEAIGFTLTLAGIAGLILSVGVTADSFVIYFERIKDEVREGRTMRASVERAWPHARRTMLSADTVSFLAAAVLYTVSVGSVRGFAFTLGLSTLFDVLIVFLFTRPLVTLLVRRRLFASPKWSGLTPSKRGVGEGARAAVTRPRLAKRADAEAAAGSGAPPGVSPGRAGARVGGPGQKRES
ncbi:protein translocase subunit SecD [Frankia sp. CNm7]|uniref:Protein translocase subunit SecD n=2 Tax=Frankia nepalensis TaxID=1836974 RepID=A0A937RD66_9ACTN|nr:protein translocase subunit SecD [Frankia nepalensis]MBL7494750.1 protein translocase subunit SecD [Frankia nepalensis]MBL7514029.1 protein translocase subunit SecD [Frankia nepalensis]MBL7524643.1 protein translocase subunit SecD [Frankia nepalensis]MBL7629961.1 protein translocase subunit SecD [Frankia nepalensis]